MIEQRAKRLLHWTCRKCGAEWSETIQLPPDGTVKPDAHHQTICDQCVEAMFERAR